jgi:ketosteroid isomerase-like protein
MSQENVAAIRAVYERWAEGDFHAAVDLDLFDPHVLLVLRPEFGPDYPDAGTLLGPPAIAAYTRDSLLKTWSDFTMEAEEIVPAGDSVLVSVHQRGIGRASGVPTEVRYFTLWTFRGHKVIRFESFRKRAEALEAAGLRE